MQATKYRAGLGGFIHYCVPVLQDMKEIGCVVQLTSLWSCEAREYLCIYGVGLAPYPAIGT
jgi:hypothetical protein